MTKRPTNHFIAAAQPELPTLKSQGRAWGKGLGNDAKIVDKLLPGLGGIANGHENSARAIIAEATKVSQKKLESKGVKPFASSEMERAKEEADAHKAASKSLKRPSHAMNAAAKGHKAAKPIPVQKLKDAPTLHA